MEWNITQAMNEDDASQIARFQVDMAEESEGLTLDPAVVFRGVMMGIEDPNAKGRYLLARTTEPVKVADDLILPVGTIAGSLFITREWSDWHCEWYWWIQSVYVRPLFRRQGAYHALCNEVVDQARRANIHEVRLYVDSENTSAQKTYQSQGMHQSHYLLYEQEL